MKRCLHHITTIKDDAFQVEHFIWRYAKLANGFVYIGDITTQGWIV